MDGEPARFRWDDEAQDFFDRFRKWLQAEVEKHRDEGHDAMVNHLAKFEKPMAALALIFHLADWAAGDEDEPEPKVGLLQARRAFEWCRYLWTHARRFYACAVPPSVSAMRRLAQLIREGHVERTFTVREIYRKHWTGLGSQKTAQAAVTELVKANWVRKVREKKTGRPAERYEVNPRIWDKGS